MRQRLSISLRLAAWYACILLVGLGVFGSVMRIVLAESMLSWKDRTLGMRAARVEAVLSPRSKSDQKSLYARLEELTGLLPEGEWIQIVGQDHQRIFPLSHNVPLATDLTHPCEFRSIRDLTVDREHFRLLCHPILYADQPAFLLVPSPLAEDHILLRNFTVGLYRTIPLILLVSSLGGYWLSRRALRPVDLLIAEARSVTVRDLSRRLTVPVADDQLRRLAMAWNDLLARIEAAVVRVTQFTADASHELRSPIAYIRATAEYSLNNPHIDEDSRESFRAIVEETGLTGDLLENLLTLAQADASYPPAELHAVSIVAIAQEVCRSVAPELQRKKQSIKIISPQAALPLVLINTLHLRRVLTAIVDNSIKYTATEGCICIRYDCTDQFLVQITDNGLGIAKENLNRIFDRFFRVDLARSDMSDGVGLGLPIAKWLMELYGGDIRVESQLGLGTTVTLVFPEKILCSAESTHAIKSSVSLIQERTQSNLTA